MNINDAVLAQIKTDVESGDLTAIEEMIKELPEDALIAYLPEALWPSYVASKLGEIIEVPRELYKEEDK